MTTLHRHSKVDERGRTCGFRCFGRGHGGSTPPSPSTPRDAFGLRLAVVPPLTTKPLGYTQVLFPNDFYDAVSEALRGFQASCGGLGQQAARPIRVEQVTSWSEREVTALLWVNQRQDGREVDT